MAWLALLALLAFPADDAVEVIVVRNRPASDLVATLEPLVGSGGSVAAMENRLIVKATPRALAQVRELVAALDVAPRSLWITVRQASGGQGATRGGSVSASVPAGAATVTVSPDGGTVTTTTERRLTVVHGSLDATSSTESGSDVQRLLCLEGRPAFIRVGRAEPAPQMAILPGPGGSVVASGTVYLEADIGFWVLPRLAGAMVTLDVATSRDAFDAAGGIDVRRTRSSVSSRLGEWIALGSSSLVRETDARGFASRASANASSTWSVDLRVEAADTP